MTLLSSSCFSLVRFIIVPPFPKFSGGSPAYHLLQTLQLNNYTIIFELQLKSLYIWNFSFVTLDKNLSLNEGLRHTWDQLSPNLLIPLVLFCHMYTLVLTR